VSAGEPGDGFGQPCLCQLAMALGSYKYLFIIEARRDLLPTVFRRHARMRPALRKTPVESF
jgi:methyl coenzyme M reductase beta subunit